MISHGNQGGLDRGNRFVVLLRMMSGSEGEGRAFTSGREPDANTEPGKNKAHFIHSSVILFTNYSSLSCVQVPSRHVGPSHTVPVRGGKEGTWNLWIPVPPRIFLPKTRTQFSLLSADAGACFYQGQV